MSEVIDPDRCPFCKKPNGCMARSEEPCWCNNIKVPSELCALIPPENKMKACICKACILAFKEDAEKFIKEYAL